MIINAGIKEIVYLEDYKDDLADELLREADIFVRK
jgi:deoxycytidylate deaminase